MDKVEQKNFKNNLRWKYSFMALSALMIMLISFICFTKEDAWLFLGFSGTALSIVLSVIAILITLIDVAGQKQQVVDITNSAKELREVLEMNKQLNEEYVGSLEKLIKENSREQIIELTELINKLPDKINEESSNDDLQELSKNVAEAKKKINDINQSSAVIDIDNLIKAYNFNHSIEIPKNNYIDSNLNIKINEDMIKNLNNLSSKNYLIKRSDSN